LSTSTSLDCPWVSGTAELPAGTRATQTKELIMKNFLAVYTGTPDSFEKSAWSKLDPAARKEKEAAAMQAWMDWGNRNEAAIVENGAPLGKTKRISREGISDIRNAMTGYTVVRAETHEAAAKMFLNHPHFTIFPGEAVEIMECLPMPGQ